MDNHLPYTYLRLLFRNDLYITSEYSEYMRSKGRISCYFALQLENLAAVFQGPLAYSTDGILLRKKMAHPKDLRRAGIIRSGKDGELEPSPINQSIKFALEDHHPRERGR